MGQSSVIVLVAVVVAKLAFQAIPGWRGVVRQMVRDLTLAAFVHAAGADVMVTERRPDGRILRVTLTRYEGQSWGKD